MNVVLLLACGLLISITYALGKLAKQAGVDGIELLFWQISGSVLIVFPCAMWAGQLPKLQKDHVQYYTLAGLMGFTGPYLITYWVLNYIPSGLVGVVASLSPLLTFALVLILFRGKVKRSSALGLLLGFIGVLAILLPKNSLPSPGMFVWVLLACASPLLLAAGNVYRTRAWPINGKPLQMAAGLLASQWALLLPVYLTSHPMGLPTQALFPVLSIAVLSGVFYLISFELQRRTTPVFVGQLGYVIALCSLLIGIVFFKEIPSLWVWLGAALIAVGVYWVSNSKSAGGTA
ncbi:MAG: DMT family transporter [Burkholderiales bacterium]|jgi:drug/metabolite transporter (DMT)-like permease|uniref:DMT family transporter n=1 Tax=Limnobacter sp. TaxID=2003368 RepID=UPI00395542BB|nr:DMT family transporter [Burkholderiales bacterium]